MVILRNDEMFFRNTLAGSNILLLKLKLGRDTHTKKTQILSNKLLLFSLEVRQVLKT